MPLTKMSLHSEAANTLLKTLEEPGANVTFLLFDKR